MIFILNGLGSKFNLRCHFDGSAVIRMSLNVSFEAISKIVDYHQGQGKNRFKSGAYTAVFKHF
jgi:hypothetical protein